MTSDLTNRLTLGGGMGWLTGEHGMIIDSLLEATVVTGAGEIICTSGDDDLFWAIRGGGAGSGVVTSMTFKLHKQQQDVFWGVMAMEPEQPPAVIRFVNKMTAENMNTKSAVYIKLWAKKVGVCTSEVDLSRTLPSSRSTTAVKKRVARSSKSSWLYVRSDTSRR